MPYKVHLVYLGSGLEETVRKKVAEVLKTWFEAVVTLHDEKHAKTNKQGGVEIVWTNSTPTVANHELLCYFVPSSADSVVKHMSTFKGSTSGSSGLTHPDTGTPVGSEVYVSEGKKQTKVAESLAALAFHELMHNKLRWGDAKLHGTDGGGGLAASPVNSESKLTDKNKDIMAKALANDVPQWTGGVTAWHDPLNGHI